MRGVARRLVLLGIIVGCGDPGPPAGGGDETTGSAGSSTGSGDDPAGSTSGVDGSTSAASTGEASSDGGESSTGAQACPDPAPAMSADVVLPTPTGNIYGTFASPEGCAPFPTVLFHVGSGPTDRDGNTVGAAGSNDGHLQLAQALLDAGVASVRFDKRGIAESQDALDDPQDVVIETYVDDLVAWVELLREQSDLVGELVVLGHSEGSLIGTLAAAQVEMDALVLVAGPGRPLADVLRTQLEDNLDPALLEQANAILDELEAGNTVDDVPPDLLFLFHPNVQPFLISLFAHDPAQALTRVTAPTMLIAGSEDIQIPVSEAEVLHAAKPDADLRVIEGMTHVLKDAAMGQDAAYTDPDVPLADGLVDAVLDAVATAGR